MLFRLREFAALLINVVNDLLFSVLGADVEADFLVPFIAMVVGDLYPVAVLVLVQLEGRGEDALERYVLVEDGLGEIPECRPLILRPGGGAHPAGIERHVEIVVIGHEYADLHEVRIHHDVKAVVLLANLKCIFHCIRDK